MMKSDFARLEPDASVWLAPHPTNARTLADLGALRELLPERADELIRGRWLFLARCSATGNPIAHGMSARLRSAVDPDVELLAHRNDLRGDLGAAVVEAVVRPAGCSPRAPRKSRPAMNAAARQEHVRRRDARWTGRLHLVEPPAGAPSSESPPAPASSESSPYRLSPSPPPWASNENMGAIYLQREPGGTFRVALVLTDPGAPKGKQVAQLSALPAAEIPEATALLGKRLAGHAAGVGDKAKGGTGS